MKKYKKLVEVMSRINTSTNFNDLLRNIIDSAKELIGVDAASYLVKDEETDELIFDVVISDKGQIITGKRLKIGEGVAGHVAQTKQPIIINDAANCDIFCDSIDQMSGYTTNNIIAVPVSINDKLIGVLEAVNSTHTEGFSDTDIAMLSYLADAASIAINKHDLLVSLKNRVNELTCIYEISQSIYFTFNIDEFLERILEAVNKIIKAKRCSFALLDEKNSEVVHFASTEKVDYTIDLKNSLMQYVIDSGDPLLVHNVNHDFQYISKRIKPKGMEKGDYSSDSFICVPMKIRDKILGVLNVTDKQSGASFDSFDLRVLATIANQVAETYENILFEKEKSEREKLQNELKIASELQVRSLSPVPKNTDQVSFGAFSIPAQTVGGDFFEISMFSNDQFSCSIGDVSGKGVHAAIFMNSIRNALRFESLKSKEPEILLPKVNQWAYNESYKGMFCTFVYCLIDIPSQSISYSSAGHNAQLYFDAAQDEFQEIKIKGKPLGIDDQSLFEVKTLDYKKDDLLILFTDGLIEENSDSAFTMEDLTNFIIENKEKDAKTMVSILKDNILKIASNGNMWDDSTLLIVKFE